MARGSHLGAHLHPLVDHGRDAASRWTCRVVGPDGREERVEGATQTECWDAAEGLLLRLGVRAGNANLTITAAVAMYVADRRRAGVWSESTVLRVRQDLALLAVPPWLAVRTFGRNELTAWLDRMRAMRFGSQRTRWASAVGFWHWAVAREIVAASPLRLVDRLDKPWLSNKAKRQAQRGKRQLANAAEAAAYLRAAKLWPKAADRVGSALPLLCGLRSGELRHLRVADVDFELQRLWVRDDVDDDDDQAWSVKTASSRRIVELPDELVEDIAQLCKYQDPDAYLFRSVSTRNGRERGGVFESEWLRRLVGRTCKAAGITIVCAHGLRGTYASILAAHGEASPAIGRHLGHADGGKTAERHYIGAKTAEPALRVVPGGGFGQGRGAGSTCGIEGALWRSGRDLKPRSR
jgi:integrase